MSKNIAIIGASYLQLPLIKKAAEMGYKTHVFAWECGDVGEKEADFFYPISIVERELILEKCREIGICGICSIASDLAMLTVNYVADALGLPSNSPECTRISTNKHLMREAFEKNNDPSPKSILIKSPYDIDPNTLSFPVIIKPTDRSGSRGIFKLENAEGFESAVNAAISESFEKTALVEEYAQGTEYSVECVSYNGEHYFLAITLKYTTGAPHFIETGHLQPAPVSNELLEKIKKIVFHALTSLKITTGASHTELKIAKDGTVRLIEIGGRMGGDFIGSHLVYNSTGIDFVGAVIEIAVGLKPNLIPKAPTSFTGVRFIFNNTDLEVLQKIKVENPSLLILEDVKPITDEAVTDSSNRFGAFIISGNNSAEIEKYLPIFL